MKVNRQSTFESRPVCFITGVAGGVGRSLVEVFSAAGYSVIGTDLIDKISTLPLDEYIQADMIRFVEKEDYANELLTNVKGALNGRGINVLINNAAIQILGEIRELTRQDWSDSLSVNLLAPFFLCQGLLDEISMVKGVIINISSIHAKLTKKNFSAYSTSKAALSAMTKALAIELGGKIRVNAIEPAAIDTEMLRAGFRGDPLGFELLKEFHPTGSIADPEEIGRLSLMLADPKFQFLNGSIVSIDGGIASCLNDPSR